MPITHDFEYIKPKTLNELLELLSKYGKKAKILAGGTDLIVQMKEDVTTPDVVIDIKGIDELKKLEVKDSNLFIGANITFTELIESKVVQENFPMLVDAGSTVGSVGIRNRATIVGNICSAVPSLDSGPPLLIYDAEVIVKSKEGERRISIHDWFTGPKKTALKENEVVIGISIPLPTKKSGECYVKLGRYKGEDLAQAGVGILVSQDKQYKISFCAVGPVPTRGRKIENLLNGKDITDSLIKSAQDLVEQEISPITDIRSTKEYRLHLVKVMLERGLKSAVARLNGEKVDMHSILGG